MFFVAFQKNTYIFCFRMTSHMANKTAWIFWDGSCFLEYLRFHRGLAMVHTRSFSAGNFVCRARLADGVNWWGYSDFVGAGYAKLQRIFVQENLANRTRNSWMPYCKPPTFVLPWVDFRRVFSRDEPLEDAEFKLFFVPKIWTAVSP